ncbi:MAG TPA: MFS transporter, partial [Moraxellaceae bacterium]|nr:MFS transporter [Moraxellaceae bacterium]
MSAWQMGLIISMVGIIWVASVRFWGKLSDRYGRIGVLLYALIGFMLSCVVL